MLFSLWHDTGWEPASIHVQRFDGTGRSVVVERNGGYPRYVRDGAAARGFLVYARQDGLMAAPFDETTLKITGAGVPMFDGLITNLSGGAHFDVSASGTLAYAPANETRGSLSTDGRWVVYQSNATGRFEIYAKAFPSGEQEYRLSAEGGLMPKWHPSGREVFYRSPWNAIMAVGSPRPATASHPLCPAGYSTRPATTTRTRCRPMAGGSLLSRRSPSRPRRPRSGWS